MEFCVECGHKRENNEQMFCVNCGASLSKETKQGLDYIQPHHDVAETLSSEPVKVKKEMTKKQKRMFAISSVLLVVFIGLYFIGNHFTSHARLIDKFSDAIHEQDAVKIGEMVSFSDSDDKIGEDHAKAFLSLLDEELQRRQEVIEELQIQANYSQPVDASNYLVSLVKSDGFLFYDTYELVMEPIYIILHTNLKDAKLFVGDKEVTTSDSTDFVYEYGPMTAGNYTFRAEMDNAYVDLETTTEATITNWDNFESIYLTMDATYIEFDVEDLGKLDTRLLINDEAVEFNLFEEDVFGPIIAEETKVSAEVEFPWGTMISEPEYPYDYYRLNFSLSEDMQIELAEEIAAYHKSYWGGWQKNNTSEFAYLPDDLINNIKSEFSYYHSDDDTFERQSVLAEIDKQNIEIIYENGDYILFINMMEEYIEDSYYDPDYKNPWDRISYYQVELRYDDGWKVYNLHDSYEYIEDPLKLELVNDLYVIHRKNEVDDEDASSDNRVGVETDVLNYIEYLVEAINSGNYQLVEPYIQDGSALHEMQKDLVDRLFKNGTTQEVVAASVESVDDTGDDWTVTTNETIKIIYESGKEETKSFVWNYTVEADGNGFVLTNIESVE